MPPQDAPVASPAAVRRLDAAPAKSAQRTPPDVLSGPVVPTLVKLALPTFVVLLVQTLVGVAETYFVSRLGTDALAGVALVFPVLMLMVMMSNGGIGGGVASAVARARGAGRTRDADALVLHAVVVGVVFGLLFAAGALIGGPWLYRLLGGTGAALDAALAYSTVVFGGAVLSWIGNLISAALRGAGDVLPPAFVTFAGALFILPASPLLIFGWGPIPAFGIAGAGLAVVTFYALGTIALVVYACSARSAVRLRLGRLEWRLFRQILGVGGLSAIGTVQANLTVTLFTGLVGRFGTEALAGYGIASRLDYLLIPLLFALGTATLTMVGTNIGAGHVARARRIAWSAAWLAAAAMELVGVTVALMPNLWLGLFSTDPKVLAAGGGYLRIAGPLYGMVGLGMLLYFASQGAKAVGWPVLAGTARLLIATLGGWLAVEVLGADLSGLYLVAALSSLAFGGFVALAVTLQPWTAPTRSSKPA